MKAQTKPRRGTGTGAGAVKPPRFDGSTSRGVFWCQFNTLAEHNCCMCLDKSTHLDTALRGRATNMLHGVPKGTTYEEIFEALEDSFGDQHLATVYRSQLEMRTQGVREAL
jgi:hypothetical protein